jgi:hypothetical protein
LEFRFRLRFAEQFRAALAVCLRLGPASVVHLVFPAAGLFVLAAAVARGRAPGALEWVAALAGLLFTPLVVLFTVAAAWAGRRGSPEIVVALGEDGVSVTSPAAAARWEALAEVRETGWGFLFFLARRAAVVVPKRAVGGEPGVAALRAYVRARAGARARLRT